jgi:excisionase family DNA binding protein
MNKPEREERRMPAKLDEVNSPILTVPETAKFLRVSESLLWKMLRANQITALRLGKRVLFSRTYLEKFCEGK